MAHYAKVLDGKVINVIRAEAEFFNTFVDDSPGEWIQTSYNTHGGVHKLGGTPLRKNYANIGGNYDRVNDAFYNQQPFPSWTLNSTSYVWEPPITYPTDGKDYYWKETLYQSDNTKGWYELGPGAI
tara:strand:- start:359 stop:736 length:378 start_codon:yes stop_codon:yes gene_type:complete